MNKYKVYLDGEVIEVEADNFLTTNNGWLQFYNGTEESGKNVMMFNKEKVEYVESLIDKRKSPNILEMIPFDASMCKDWHKSILVKYKSDGAYVVTNCGDEIAESRTQDIESWCYLP